MSPHPNLTLADYLSPPRVGWEHGRVGAWEGGSMGGWEHGRVGAWEGGSMGGWEGGSMGGGAGEGAGGCGWGGCMGVWLHGVDNEKCSCFMER